MSSISERAAAIKARYTKAVSEKDAAISLRAQAEAAMSDATALAEKWRLLADTTYWAELSSGASIAVGDRVRYLLKTYECVEAHTKALTRSPLDAKYWAEVIE